MSTTRYLCTFHGCKRGAIGLHYTIVRVENADSPEHARDKLYDLYDHITRLAVEDTTTGKKYRP